MTAILSPQGDTITDTSSTLAAGIEQILAEVRRRADSLLTEFVLEIDLEAACAEPGPLPAILGHLIENSLDAIARAPRPTSEQAPHRILVAIEHTGSALDLTVTDTGDGLAESVLDPRGQLVFGRSIKPGATGLGLRLVRDAVERTGGTFEISSYPHGGAHARVAIPVVNQKHEPREAA